MKTKKIFSALLAGVLSVMMLPAATGSAATVITGNTIGSEDGYDYELWKDSGNTTMTLTGGGTFSCEWSDINNALFRKGKKFDSTQTHEELGGISVEYEVDYNPNGNSYLCVYGWTKDPLIEYYIVDSWGSWRPPGADSKGTITVDGGTYDVYVTTRENQPSIIGNTTFQQYWSVRQDKRTSGTISVSEHFEAWEKMGMTMGKMYETALCVEGYQSSGSATVKKFDISVGGAVSNPDPTDPPAPVEPDENGYYFHSTYESGNDSWTVRGDDSVETSGSAAYLGSKSLYVSGRTQSWNGAGYTLDTSVFRPGTAYSFSAMVMQDEIDSESFKLSLQYDLDGEANYATVAEGTGAKGEWVQLANTSFTIPSGASNLLLYMETAENLTSFYMDEAIGAPQGTVYELKEEPTEPPTTEPETTEPETTEPETTEPETTEPETTEPVPELPAKGDVNYDQEVGLLDVVALQRFLLGGDNPVYAETTDLDGDEKISAFDLAILKRMVFAA